MLNIKGKLEDVSNSQEYAFYGLDSEQVSRAAIPVQAIHAVENYLIGLIEVKNKSSLLMGVELKPEYEATLIERDKLLYSRFFRL